MSKDDFTCSPSEKLTWDILFLLRTSQPAENFSKSIYIENITIPEVNVFWFERGSCYG